MKRLTAKKLIEWCNESLPKIGFEDFEVTEIRRTHFTEEQYSSGACRLYVFFKSKKDEKVTDMFLCFYSLGYLQEAINNGYDLYLKHDARSPIFDIEIELMKQ